MADPWDHLFSLRMVALRPDDLVPSGSKSGTRDRRNRRYHEGFQVRTSFPVKLPRALPRARHGRARNLAAPKSGNQQL